MKIRIMVAALAAAFLPALWAAPSLAQGVSRICVESVGANGSNNCVDASSLYPFPVAGIGSGNLATSQATATTTPSVICPARTGRYTAVLQNLGTTQVWFGASSSVSPTIGGLLPGAVGQMVTLSTGAAIYGVTASGTQTVACYETY